jgi:hypothetical protein
LTIEQTTGLGKSFSTLLTTNPPVSPITILFTPPAATSFFRASHP